MMFKRIIIMFSTCILLTKASDTKESDYKTFNEWRAEYLELTTSSIHPRNIDEDCVEKNLNFAENGHKKMSRYRGIDTIGLGYDMCTEGIQETWETAIWFLAQAINDEFENKVDCFKKELKRIEPNGKIVEDFDPDSMTISDDECTAAIESESFQKFLSQILGNIDIKKDACDKITQDEVRAFGCRMVVLKHGNLPDPDIARVNSAKLIFGIQKKVFDCQIEKINKIK
ncbi:hypothetical protein PVAND_014629 [Polypedilum vanderplanki]|uniref:Secreted protein n=1 Tax=Polypedilum vanderplanki TaxID=319348 RepID=A0A9J6BA95_POLVA|nr:hypothetical protein PVAND_014629 [Polypedilum vanderplanki]